MCRGEGTCVFECGVLSACAFTKEIKEVRMFYMKEITKFLFILNAIIKIFSIMFINSKGDEIYGKERIIKTHPRRVN